MEQVKLISNSFKLWCSVQLLGADGAEVSHVAVEGNQAGSDWSIVDLHVLHLLDQLQLFSLLHPLRLHLSVSGSLNRSHFHFKFD